MTLFTTLLVLIFERLFKLGRALAARSTVLKRSFGGLDISWRTLGMTIIAMA
ncbi:regulatory signaling modulator protein AmpE [Shigella flexneri]